MSSNEPAVEEVAVDLLDRAMSGTAVRFDPVTQEDVRAGLRQRLGIVFDPGSRRMGWTALGDSRAPVPSVAPYELAGILPPLFPEWLGDRGFREEHNLRFAYLGGSMARGIGSVPLVIELARGGAMGMFGAAGLPVDQVAAAIDALRADLDPEELSWGCNLIHSPDRPGVEDALVDLFLERGVRRVEASAFMRITPAVVRYACTGLVHDADGRVDRPNHLFAKVSREEVARQFLSPPPAAMLEGLVASGGLTEEEARIASRLPLSEAIIVEADSGGHTDNRVLGTVFPAIVRLRDEIAAEFGFARPVRIGAAGGLGTPEGVAAAFALGAAFVVVGTVHQAAVESGVSDEAREMLAQAGPADIAMTASADMFEMGVKVQVLTAGTLMAARGNQLLELYRRYGSVDELPADIRGRLEEQLFRMPLDQAWAETRSYFQQIDPSQIERAEREPKHRLALLFRSYLGRTSRWPIDGESSRRIDYQLWCGPAMGAFNRWVQDSFLADPSARTVQQIALNLLEGAAAITRAHQLRSYGLSLSSSAFRYDAVPLRT